MYTKKHSLHIVTTTLFCLSVLCASVYAQAVPRTALQEFSLRFYCRLSPVFNADTTRCAPVVTNQTQEQILAVVPTPTVLERVRTVFIPEASAQNIAPISTLEATIRRIITELLPQAQTIVIQGTKGEKGDKGDTGAQGTSGQLQAFSNIPMPFWNGSGNGGVTGGGTTIVNNVTNVFGSSSTSSLVSLQDAYNFGGAGLGREINTSAGGPIDIAVQDGLGFFNGLTITGTTNTNQGMVFGKSDVGAGQQAAFGFSDDITNIGTVNGLFANYNFAANRFGLALRTGAVTSTDINMRNPATSVAAIELATRNGGSNVLALNDGLTTASMVQHVGFGSPESVITAFSGSVFYRVDGIGGNEQLYIKTTDGGNTGWVALGGASTSTSPITIENGNSLFATGLSLPSGVGATAANNSIFLGLSAGGNAVNAGNSNFFGASAGNGATDAFESNFFGANAGTGAISANTSNFFGLNTGTDATNANNSNFFGSSAGNQATSASDSNFFGTNAGFSSTNASFSNFFGNGAGQNATNASFTNFFGVSAGDNATDAGNANFIGRQAGQSATNAADSNFIGTFAGNGAASANFSNFIGTDAGNQAVRAANSIFIGRNAGFNDSVDNTSGSASILIGNNTNTGGFSDSIALGAGAVNTATNQLYIRDAITNFNLAGVNYNFPTAQAVGANYTLVNDGSGNLSWVAPGTGSVTASNGLTAVGSDVRLGGILDQVTTITAAGNDVLSITNGSQTNNSATVNVSRVAAMAGVGSAFSATAIVNSAPLGENVAGRFQAVSGNTGVSTTNYGILSSAGTGPSISSVVNVGGRLVGSSSGGSAGQIYGSQNAASLTGGSANLLVGVTADVNLQNGTNASSAFGYLASLSLGSTASLSRYSGFYFEDNNTTVPNTSGLFLGTSANAGYTGQWGIYNVINRNNAFVGNTSIGSSTASFITEKLNVAGNLKVTGAFMPGNNAGATGTVLISQGSGLAPIWGAAPASISTVVNSIVNVDTTLLGTDDQFQGVNTTAAFRVITLPPAANREGQMITIFKTASANYVEVNRAPGDSINFAPSSYNIVPQDERVTFVSDGVNNWQTVAQEGTFIGTNGITAGQKGNVPTPTIGDLGKFLSANGTWQDVASAVSSSTVASALGFIQNGNSFGTTTIIGTNDLQNFAFETNNTQRASFRADNQFGLELFNIDTTNRYAYSIRNTSINLNYSLWDGATQDWLLGFNDNQFLLVDRTDNRDMMRITKSGGVYTTVIGDPTTPSGNVITLSNNNVGYGNTTFGLNSSRKFFITDGSAVRFWVKPSNVLSTDTVNYESLVLADNDIPNRRFVFNNFFAQNGNAFGSLATIGTTDSNSLRFIASSTEAMRVTQNGSVGVGNVAPLFLFHVGSSSILSGTTVARFENAGGTCDVTPNVAGGITCTSDQNLKKDIESIDPIDSLTKLLNVEVKSYRMNADTATSTKQIGYLAQQLETKFPGLVLTSIEGNKSVSYAGMTPILTQAIQTLYKFMTDIGVTVEDGVAKVGDFFANRVYTKELCIGERGSETCITQGQLNTILQGHQGQIQNTYTDQGGNENNALSTSISTTSDSTGTRNQTEETNTDSTEDNTQQSVLSSENSNLNERSINTQVDAVDNSAQTETE